MYIFMLKNNRVLRFRALAKLMKPFFMEQHKMKVEVVSKSTIKPSSSTPQHLKTYNLSFIDQLAPIFHTRMMFFYPNIEDKFSNGGRERLKTSLSETLAHFYPLAGRVKDNKVIECNDEGVEFCETRVHGFLSDILKQPDADFVHQCVPVDDAHLGSGFLVKVQVNLFDCGGLAIGVSFSHKIADASTIGSFIKVWSCTAVGCNMTDSLLPKYVMESHFPSMEFSNDLPPLEFKPASNCITRRYVFEYSDITKLKAKASSKLVEQPTRVEVVLALLWKCATIASRTNLGITKRPSKVGQAINIRKRTNPPLPETSVGNCLSNFIAEIEDTNDNNINMDLKTLVVQLRKALEIFSEERAQKLGDKNNAFSILSEGWKDVESAYKEDIDFYMCTSWCRFGFYEADFGWGKPKWVSIPSMKLKNSIYLMDMSDGKGIEAWVTLSEQDMASVEKSDELLEFASLNPTIV